MNISSEYTREKKRFETACVVEDEDFNWNREIIRFKAKVNRTSNKEELKQLSIDFNRKMTDFNFPTELEEELEGIKKVVNSRMYSLSMQKLFASNPWNSQNLSISLQYQRTFGKNFNSKRRWYLQLIHMPKKK